MFFFLFIFEGTDDVESFDYEIMNRAVDLRDKLSKHLSKIRELKKDIEYYEKSGYLVKQFPKLTIQDLPMATSSAWDKVFASSSRSPQQSDVSVRTIKPNRVYEIGEYITVIFQTEEEQVIIDTIGYGKLYFTYGGFQEFLSMFDCFKAQRIDILAIIDKYTVVFHHNGDKRSVKFEDSNTDKYLFRWTEKPIHQFARHIYMNCIK